MDRAGVSESPSPGTGNSLAWDSRWAGRCRRWYRVRQRRQLSRCIRSVSFWEEAGSSASVARRLKGRQAGLAARRSNSRRTQSCQSEKTASKRRVVMADFPLKRHARRVGKGCSWTTEARRGAVIRQTFQSAIFSRRSWRVNGFRPFIVIKIGLGREKAASAALPLADHRRATRNFGGALVRWWTDLLKKSSHPALFPLAGDRFSG